MLSHCSDNSKKDTLHFVFSIRFMQSKITRVIKIKYKMPRPFTPGMLRNKARIRYLSIENGHWHSIQQRVFHDVVAAAVRQRPSNVVVVKALFRKQYYFRLDPNETECVDGGPTAWEAQCVLIFDVYRRCCVFSHLPYPTYRRVHVIVMCTCVCISAFWGEGGGLGVSEEFFLASPPRRRVCEKTISLLSYVKCALCTYAGCEKKGRARAIYYPRAHVITAARVPAIL